MSLEVTSPMEDNGPRDALVEKLITGTKAGRYRWTRVSSDAAAFLRIGNTQYQLYTGLKSLTIRRDGTEPGQLQIDDLPRFWELWEVVKPQLPVGLADDWLIEASIAELH